MPAHSKDPATRQRTNKASTRAVLPAEINHDVPPLPAAHQWIGSIDEGSDGKVDWSPVVYEWWETIWSSPMSNEFHESDIPQLYLAAFYLQQVTNPWLKVTERLAAGKQHEAMVKNFGLNPMSRRSLQWEIEKVSEAQDRSAHRRPPKDVPQEPTSPHRPDPRQEIDEDDENPFAARRRAAEQSRLDRKAGAS